MVKVAVIEIFREGVETCQGWRQENLGVRSKKTKQDRQNAAGMEKMVGYDHVHCDYEREKN